MAEIELDDRQIIELIGKKDEAGLKAAMDKYGRLCFSIALGILKNRDDAEECVNDVWVQLWNNADTISSLSLLGFLTKTTRNKAIDYYRKKRGTKHVLNSTSLSLSEIDAFIPSAINVEETVMNRLIIERINKFLQKCDAFNRIVFVKRYVYCESIADISREMHCSYMRVYKTLSKMKKEIKTYLEEVKKDEYI